MAKVKNAVIQHMNADYAEIERRVMADVADRWRGTRAEVEATIRDHYSDGGLYGHDLEVAVQAEMKSYDFIKAGELTGRTKNPPPPAATARSITTRKTDERLRQSQDHPWLVGRTTRRRAAAARPADHTGHLSAPDRRGPGPTADSLRAGGRRG